MTDVQRYCDSSHCSFRRIPVTVPNATSCLGCGKPLASDGERLFGDTAEGLTAKMEDKKRDRTAQFMEMVAEEVQKKRRRP
jgi:hypothetical protein